MNCPNLCGQYKKNRSQNINEASPTSRAREGRERMSNEKNRPRGLQQITVLADRSCGADREHQTNPNTPSDYFFSALADLVLDD